jgi:amphi-Trp domain-containing protein
MAKEIVLFKSEEKKDLQSVSDFLHQLADRLAHNKVILRRGAEEITLDISNQVILELKVEEENKKGKTKHTLEVKIEWIKGDES